MIRILLLCLCLAGCSGAPGLSPLDDDATILVFGDSLTFGTGVAADKSYPSVLGELSGRRVIRSGVPGELSAQGKSRLPHVLARTDPDLVILCHGGNDVLRRMSPSVTERNLRDMIRTIRAHGAEVALLAVPKPGLFPGPWEYYEDLAEELDVPVQMDVVSDLMADVSMKSDQVHFNEAGYRKMAQAVHALLTEAGALQSGDG